jgi:hypothetical protein
LRAGVSMRARSPPHHPVPLARRPRRGPVALTTLPLLEVRLDHRREAHALSELFLREGSETHLIACRLTDRAPRRLMRWLDVEIAPERTEHLLHALRRRLHGQQLAYAHLGPGRVLMRVSEPAPPICTATYRAGGICVACPLMSRKERDAWRVVLPRGVRTKNFLRDLPSASGGRLAIARLKPYRSESTLTRRQDRALRVAYGLGYFDYPRRGSLGDVARALGVGRSAALEILRRATTKLAGSRYGTDLRVRAVP